MSDVWGWPEPDGWPQQPDDGADPGGGELPGGLADDPHHGLDDPVGEPDPHEAVAGFGPAGEEAGADPSGGEAGVAADRPLTGGDPYATDWYGGDLPGADPDGSPPADPPPDAPAGWEEASAPEQATYPPTAPPVGADPDLLDEPDPGDDDWAAGFPAPLRLGPGIGWRPDVEAVDGHPWTDPNLLGDVGGHTWPEAVGDLPPPEATDLAGYAGAPLPAGADPWQVLGASDDPATSALARFWGGGDPPRQR